MPILVSVNGVDVSATVSDVSVTVTNSWRQFLLNSTAEARTVDGAAALQTARQGSKGKETMIMMVDTAGDTFVRERTLLGCSSPGFSNMQNNCIVNTFHE